MARSDSPNACNAENAMRLVQRLLDPEDFGHAVTPEIRDAARRVLGYKPVETTHHETPAPVALHTTQLPAQMQEPFGYFYAVNDYGSFIGGRFRDAVERFAKDDGKEGAVFALYAGPHRAHHPSAAQPDDDRLSLAVIEHLGPATLAGGKMSVLDAFTLGWQAAKCDAPTQAPQEFDAEFLSKRLARVAKLVGYPMPVMTHEQIAAAAGTILGAIAANLEGEVLSSTTKLPFIPQPQPEHRR
jgi:hypothetical protein